MTRKITILLAYTALLAATNVAQAVPIASNASALRVATAGDVIPVQWQVWAGRLALIGTGVLAGRAWDSYHYGPRAGYNYRPPVGYYGNYGYYDGPPRRHYGYYDGPPRRYYGPPRYYYGGW